MSINTSSAATHGARAHVAVRTVRRDRWSLQPVLTEVGLLALVAYSTWAAFQNAH